jgi:hypothetical protein
LFGAFNTLVDALLVLSAVVQTATTKLELQSSWVVADDRQEGQVAFASGSEFAVIVLRASATDRDPA